MKCNRTLLAASVATICLGAAPTVGAKVLEDTSVKFSGYIKADAIASNYSEGSLPSGNLNRDFYIPGLIPVSGVDEGWQLDTHIRQSRFRFTTQTKTEDDDTITGVLEFDFMVTAGGNDRVSNSYTPRIRHAFIKYKNWLVGQTWSTFQDVGTLPETLDFVGATDGTIFDRQPMVRYTNGAFEFALENPETTVTPFGGGSRIVADDNIVPDVVARYTMKQDWGYVKVAGLLRQLTYENGANIDDSIAAYGLSVTSKIVFENGNDLRLMLNTGSGMGRYIGLNAANGAVIDASGDLEAIDSTGYSIAYRHKWNEKTRSNITFSALDVDNDTALTGTGVTESTYSTRVNLLYSPTKALTFGGEYAFAKRETEGGLEGDMNRVQFSAKYAF